MKPVIIVSFVGLPVLAACGDTQGERALSGAAIGAGGGAVGAATGAFTSPNQIDLSR